jgi:hypothetical protein
MATLVSGTTGKLLTQAAIIRRMALLEAALPKGTRVYWRGTWAVVSLPTGPVHMGAIAAAAINTAWHSGRLTVDGHTFSLWPGDRQPARYDSHTHQVTVRWQTGSSFIGSVIAAITAITVGFVASVIDVPVQILTGAALAVGAAFLAAYLGRWLFATAGSAFATGTLVATGLMVLFAFVSLRILTSSGGD